MKPITRYFLWGVLFAGIHQARAADEATSVASPKMEILRTPQGVRFGLFGAKKEKPAPTLLVFATAVDEMERQPVYWEVGLRLAERKGFLFACIDPPCHGEDSKPDEPPHLRGWRHRVERGEPLVEPFVTRSRQVLDHLIQAGFTDESQVFACGTSRGGFLAYHFAAKESRVKAVAGFSPVTDLLALSEFAKMERPELAKSLAVETVAHELAGRPVWLSIGNHDVRVDTDAAIAFTRQLVKAGVAKTTPGTVRANRYPVELIVGPSLGHSIIDRAHELAADWFLMQLPNE